MKCSHICVRFCEYAKVIYGLAAVLISFPPAVLKISTQKRNIEFERFSFVANADTIRAGQTGIVALLLCTLLANSPTNKKHAIIAMSCIELQCPKIIGAHNHLSAGCMESITQ